MLEAMHQIVTQHVLAKNLPKCIQNKHMLENIVNKANIKNFGQNYLVAAHQLW